MPKLSDAAELQDQMLATLKQQSFQELSARPQRERVPTPSNLRGLKIFVCRRAGEAGGTEITVEVQRRALLILSIRAVDGFEIFPDGRIVPFDDRVNYDED